MALFPGGPLQGPLWGSHRKPKAQCRLAGSGSRLWLRISVAFGFWLSFTMILLGFGLIWLGSWSIILLIALISL